MLVTMMRKGLTPSSAFFMMRFRPSESVALTSTAAFCVDGCCSGADGWEVVRVERQ